MDISQSFDAININPVADVSFDVGNSQDGETNETPARLSLPKNLEEFSKRDNRTLGSISDFFDCLNALKVPGPLTLTDHLIFKIGEGAQFLVYRNAHFFPPTSDSDMYTIPVAVKKSKFTLSADQRLDLSTKTARKQIHDMQLEITALQHPRLRNHRNIVSLLGYAVDQYWHEIPLLVLELAVGDLEVFAKDAERRSQWSLKQQLCMDVGAGLDVLHTCGIVHGDLKPKNVLIFENHNDSSGVPFIGKLADFGYSIDEAQHKGRGSIEVTLWTQGWEAPEIRKHIQEGSPVPAEIFYKADNYSFGLLVWSLMCLNGSKPIFDPDTSANSTAVKSIQSATGMPATLRRTLARALDMLLLQNNDERPYLVADILEDQSESCRNW
jgi:serine/threonine protein kinase